MIARFSRVVLLTSLAAPSLPACVAPHARAGRDADASIAAVRAEIDRIDAALVSIRSDLRAGRDVNQNDKWTLRLLGLAVMLLGLSYPVGKIIWLTATTLRARSAGDPARLDQAIDDRSIRDFVAFKEKCAAALTPAGRPAHTSTGSSSIPERAVD